MDENKLLPDENANEKLKLLEAKLSEAIIRFMERFSQNSIINNIDIDKKTVKEHKKKGVIPPKYFEQYIEALSKGLPSKDVIESKEIWAENNKIYYEQLSNAFKEYKKVMGIGPYLINSLFKKGPPTGNAVPEFFLEQLEESVKSINKCIKRHNIDDLSPLFLYHMNICFDAFSTITPIDFLFLSKFFRASREERKKIWTLIDKMLFIPTIDIISCLTNGEAKLWIAAYTHYLSNTGKKSSQYDIWKKFKKKIEDCFFLNESIEKKKHTFAFYYFLALIWPEEGETDTKFGPKEIEALIVFKYFLTQEAQQKLLNELQIEYP